MFDLSFRPNDFFHFADHKQKSGAKILGELRRSAAVEGVRTTYYPPELVGRKFHSYLRQKEGRKHPWLMGGEYLPELFEDEVEICRIVLKSSTMDVISFRAQQADKKLEFRVVDEYGDSEYQLPIPTSNTALTMGELITNLNECVELSADSGLENEYGGRGLVRPWLFQQFENEESLDEASDFVTVHSVFYPQLEDYYEEAKKTWYQEMLELRER